MSVDLYAEVRRGEAASAAYEGYVKSHIAAVKSNIAEGFFACGVDDVEQLIQLKALATAVQGLEISILQDIETGRLASIQLREQKDASRPN